MKLLRQLLVISGICLAGEFISGLLHLPVPGNVTSMLLLLILLALKLVKPESLENIEDFLLKNMAFFFIPAGVGLITNLSLLKSSWAPILIICLVSTVIGMAASGLTVQLMKRR